MKGYTRAEALSELALENFRVTTRFNNLADRLSRDLGLSSARWQVMGTLAMADSPITVAEIARRLGLKRQSVQRTADALADAGHVEFLDNPRHRRAKLVNLTEQGDAALEKLRDRRADWAEHITGELELEQLLNARQTLIQLRDLLDQHVRHAD